MHMGYFLNSYLGRTKTFRLLIINFNFRSSFWKGTKTSRLPLGIKTNKNHKQLTATTPKRTEPLTPLLIKLTATRS